MNVLKPSHKISLAPLQGITDYHFRNTFNEHFKGLDEAFTPFLRLDKGNKLKRSQIRDVLLENNSSIRLIPQILTNSVDEFIYFSKYLFDLGYQEINWNLGCPFPMVAKRQMGSGLLPYPEKIEHILEKVLPVIPTKVSVKMRLGYESDGDISHILPKLDKFSLTEIIIHARIGKQMYKGTTNVEVFEKCLNLSNHPICYNGDIDCFETFNKLNIRFKTVKNWMIGRAAIANPFLIEEIKGEENQSPDKKLERFSSFHFELYEQLSGVLSGSGHILSKMTHLWEYFSKSFSNSRKVYKKIKKSNSISKFEESLHQIFNEEEWIA
ncbi:MAG: tRNA-dihydrouridine synthase family protein [Bacteroidota bacterium]